MGVTQEGQKCIFMLCMEVAEEDMEVQEETLTHLLPSTTIIIHLQWMILHYYCTIITPKIYLLLFVVIFIILIILIILGCLIFT